MIVPSFRLYHFAVKLIWKRMLALTLLFWLGVAGVYYMVNEMPVWQEYGWCKGGETMRVKVRSV